MFSLDIFISLASLVTSSYAVARSLRIVTTGSVGPKGETGDVGERGERGPVGPQGETGDLGPQGPAGKDVESVSVPSYVSSTAAIVDPAHVECASCHRLVAIYNSTTRVCPNCQPLK